MLISTTFFEVGTQIACNNKQFKIGRFETEISAAIAYDKKTPELHGEFARTNILGKRNNAGYVQHIETKEIHQE